MATVFFRLYQQTSSSILTKNSKNGFGILQFVRTISKHWNPKFKRERARKVIKIDLPDYDEVRNMEHMTPDEMRAYMKEKGIIPPRPWSERPIIVSSTGGIFEPYIPPEGDGKVSTLSYVGTKQRLEWLQKKGKSRMALKKIRNFEEEFEFDIFLDKAQEIYIQTHKALAEKDEDKLHDLVTEKCFPELMINTNRRTLRWNLIKFLEPSRVVHIRTTDVITKENLFAQITVRHHSKQTLAIYDRFGRLMYGSEEMPKDVLEYVVYEKHISNQFGEWRVHGKIIPDWMPKKEPVKFTYRKEEMEPPPPIIPQEKSQNSVVDSKTE